MLLCDGAALGAPRREKTMMPRALSLFSAERRDGENIARLIETLPEISRERLRKKNYRVDSVLGELVRLYMMDECGAPYDVAENENGKPYSPLRGDISFNISHSGRIAVGALWLLPSGVGIDVEMINKKKLAAERKLAKRFFSERERLRLEECTTDDEAAREFCVTWTRKEAYLKYKGTGISRRLSDVDTSPDDTADGGGASTNDAFIKSTIITDSYGGEYALSFAVPAEEAFLVGCAVTIKRIY